MQEIPVLFLGQEDPMEMGWARLPTSIYFGFPGGSYSKESRPGFGPWVGKFPWRKVFLPGEFHQWQAIVHGVGESLTFAFTFPLAIYFTHDSVYMSVATLSVHSTFSFPHCVYKSISVSASLFQAREVLQKDCCF